MLSSADLIESIFVDGAFFQLDAKLLEVCSVAQRQEHFDVGRQLSGEPTGEQLGATIEILQVIDTVHHEDQLPLRRGSLLVQQLAQHPFVIQQRL